MTLSMNRRLAGVEHRLKQLDSRYYGTRLASGRWPRYPLR